MAGTAAEAHRRDPSACRATLPRGMMRPMAEAELQTILAIAVIGGLLAGAIASSRGLSFVGFFVFGFLLPVVGVVIALIAKAPGKLAQLTPAQGQGWWTDPTGRFEHRWFDGRHWTRHVGRDGTQFEDPL